MTIRQHLDQLLASLPEDRLAQVADFARYLHWLHEQEEQPGRDWADFGLHQLARAYGPDEPDYSEADLKPDLNP